MDDLQEAQMDPAFIKAHLQQQVDERTKQIEAVNQRLRNEIEERKKIEADLHASEAQYRLLAESAHDFIYIVDRDMRILYANTASLRFLRMTKSELLGRHIRDILPYSDVRLKDVDLFETIDSGIPLSYRNEVRFPQGTLWLDTVLVPLSDESGKIQSIMGISRDITEQKKNDEVLADQEKFLLDVFASIQDGISVLDKDLNIVRVNAKIEQWYSHSLPLAGKKCYEVYHGRSSPCHVCPSIVAIRTGKAAYEVVPLHGKDGAVNGWQDLYAYPVFDKSTGAVEGVIEHVRDITERTRAEEKVRQSEEKFRKLAETAGAGIFIVKNSKFCYVNEFIPNALGYSREEMMNMHFWDVVAPEFKEVVKDRYSSRMRGENLPTEYEFKYVRKDGSIGWASHNVGLIEFEGGPAIIGTLHEISARKRMEEALASEKELLSVTMESITDGVISVDTAGTIVSINKSALALAWRYADAPAGHHVDEVLRFVDETTRHPLPGIVRTMIQRYGVRHFERRVMIQAPEKNMRLVDLSVSPTTAITAPPSAWCLYFATLQTSSGWKQSFTKQENWNRSACWPGALPTILTIFLPE